MHAIVSSKTRRPGPTARTLAKAALTVGFVALTVAVLVAHRAPPTGYELSVYDATPTAVWVAVGAALVAATVVAFLSPGGRTGTAALVLGGGAVFVSSLVPLVRGYYFRGAGDSLTHLGWVRGIVEGAFEPFSLFYPAIHLIGIQVHAVTGVPFTRSLMLMVSFFFLVFLLSVPVAVRAVTGDPRAVTFAAVASWLVLPIDHVGVVFLTYPTAQALFFLPLLIFVLVCYLRRPNGVEGLPFGASPFGVLLALMGAGIVLIHPQQAANVLVLLGTVAAIQFVSRWRGADAPFARHRSTYAQTAFLGVVFTAWATSRPKFTGTVESIMRNITTPGAGSVGTISQRNGSLQQVGASLTDLFVRLYLVEAAFALLVAGFVLLVWLDRLDQRPDTRAVVTYLGTALVPMTVLFAVYFVATPTYGFRQAGTLMVFATLLGGVALAHVDGRLGSLLPASTGRSVVAVVLAVALVLSMVTLFPSPFVLKSSGHVSEAQMNGHQFALEHRGEGMYYSSLILSAKWSRYADVTNGVPERSSEVQFAGSRSGNLPPEVFNEGRISDAYADERYLKVSSADYQREIVMYDEFRYKAEGFRRLDGQRGLDKVESTGPFELYVIRGGAA